MKVLCVGLLTVDVTHVVAAVPGPNEKIAARSSSVVFGGPAANAAATAAALGSTTSLAAMADGSLTSLTAVTGLAEKGVAFFPLEPPAPVPVATVLVTESTGERAVISGYRALPTAELGDFPDFDVLLVDGHCLGAAIPAARSAKREGKTVVLDGGSWKPGLEELLSLTDVAILSADFAAPSDVQINCPFVARSRGANDIELIGPSRRFLPVPSVQVVDSVGAGDVLHGAFAHFIAGNQLSVDSVCLALTQAGAIASKSCEYPGALGWTEQQAPCADH